MQAKTQTLKMTIVSGLRIIDSNAQTGITWWNWTSKCLVFITLLSLLLIYLVILLDVICCFACL
ncbi:hypothetical protein [uncultured Gammaproteobacteria bacterium]|nr:hypothetical protein [uncultured Gammaproteobacteria bacterium]CAC9576976.1 hypothetical protein [uncultured Gammaproteobacteria bacterium]CAC9656806.1 hypothetical protein [uncultured Gammaproteobacteria bacterium]